MKYLVAFMQNIPKDFHYAVEFRHISWFNQATEETLSSHGVSWASTEYLGLPQTLHITADHIYIRWIGQHGRFSKHDREQIDLTNNLLDWKDQLSSKLSEKQSVFGFFNNDYAGFAPETCNRFKKLLDLPTKSLTPPQQKTLF
jgi:uncharacterized protein YecE (DUF72 family)